MTADIAAVVVQLDRIGTALERIATAVEHVASPPEAEPGSSECTHPDDARMQLGGMGESDGFKCMACGVVVEPVKLDA